MQLMSSGETVLTPVIYIHNDEVIIGMPGLQALT
jgi:hypothetical protein